MKLVLIIYGNKSSPRCSNCTLKRSKNEQQDIFELFATEFVSVILNHA